MKNQRLLTEATTVNKTLATIIVNISILRVQLQLLTTAGKYYGYQAEHQGYQVEYQGGGNTGRG